MNGGALGSIANLFWETAGGGFDQIACQQQQQQQLANYVYTSAGTMIGSGTTLPFNLLPHGVQLPPGASPADPPEILWLKNRIDEVCWRP